MPNFYCGFASVIVAVKVKLRCGSARGLKSLAGRAYRTREIVRDAGLSAVCGSPIVRLNW